MWSIKHCIYLITNLINGKQYVRQTIDFHTRKIQHCNSTRDQVISKAIYKHGSNNFKFEIIHKDIPTEKIDDWEKYYINEVYNTCQ